MPFSNVNVPLCGRMRQPAGRNQNKKSHPLQVRTLIRKGIHYFRQHSGKKAVLSLSGSMTLEAALGLTLFIFASVSLMLPMKIMNTERRVQAGLESVGEDFSKYAYLKYSAEKGKLFASVGAGDFAKSFSQNMVNGAGEGYAYLKLQDRIDTASLVHLNLMHSEILTDGESIDLIAEYEIRMPFPVLGISSLKRTARCRRRAWIGKAGKDYDGDGEPQEEGEDRIVYVGKNSTRYHLSRSCHYLSNSLRTVPKAAVSGERNSGGSRYRPCAVCGSAAASQVYIMPSGESYHTDPDCRAINAYVRAVKLSEVEHLGACSYCGK